MAELPALAVSDFPAFFAALWGTGACDDPSPFPWQKQLVAQLAKERRWPDLVDLPTGTGKTSLLEIAIFLQALDAERPPQERWMPRRIVLVVDRRVVVDQADDRGSHIALRLGAATDGVLWAVAARLRHLFAGTDTDPPLVRSVLRGGIVREEVWARRPDVPALISSTVDQVGSRLLFRGYGVSAAMRPVHAGLLAHDCLFLLDEVHLARPFAETLAAVGDYRGWAAHAEHSQAIGRQRWQVVELSATPMGAAGGARFPRHPLDPDSHPVLRRRLTAAKPATLVAVDLPANPVKADRAFAERCVRETLGLLANERVRTLGVVVNRVNTARIAAELLDAATHSRRADALDADILLLTGRMRPFERDRIVQAHRARLSIGRERRAEDRRLIVVATQCIEAGADFDLDGLVSECASLDALRQRFGRVDRDGRLAAGGEPANSVILARRPLLTETVEDPVYGSALAATWRWLETLEQVNFGITALAVPDGEQLARLSPPRRRAPTLLPAHLDALVQTSPGPAIEPEVGLWLHGIEEPAAEVHVVWRADLTEKLLRDAPSIAVERVQACAPVSGEALTLSLAVVRRWLSGGAPGDLADVEGVEVADGEEPFLDGKRPAVRWAGSESAVVRAPQLRPGDLVVVPSAYGGLARASWAPDSHDPVEDVATAAVAAQRRLAVLRLVPALWPGRRFPDPEEYAAASARERQRIVDVWLEEQLMPAHGEQVSSLDALAGSEGGSNGRTPGPSDATSSLDALAGSEGGSDGRAPGPSAAMFGLSGLLSEVRASRAPARRVQLLGGPEVAAGGAVAASLLITAPLPKGDESGRPRVAVAPLPLDVEGDSDAASFTGAREEATLDRHLLGVERWVGLFAERAGLPPTLAGDLRLAARLHDLGKADARFQVWLRGGDEVALGGSSGALAKSATPFYDRSARAAARERSGYPLGARHELTSTAMCEGALWAAALAHDWELVLHLIASHHGFCRPFAPLARDEESLRVAHKVKSKTLRASSDHRLACVDSGVAERFWRLVRRYGWYGLAWLEATLRLADHCQSEAESLREVGRG
jgi:CRISPR-associated endonuclease/helicase Cas3